MGRCAAESVKDQSIPYRRFIDDQSGSCRIELKLLSKSAHGDPQIFCSAFLSWSPRRAQKMRVGENASGVLRELGKDRIFLGCQMNLLAISADGSTEEIDRYSIRFDRLLIPVQPELDEARDVLL